jgi:putative redox protein
MSKPAEKVSIPNMTGQKLAALLHRTDPSALTGVHVNCFTCTKEGITAHRMSQGMAARDWNYLRFDLSGVGESEGTFEESNVTRHLNDVRSAVHWLAKQEFRRIVLFGHSYGGCLSLSVAQSLAPVLGAVIIGTPRRPNHVTRHFREEIERVKATGSSPFTVVGKTFTMTRQFLADLQHHSVAPRLLTKPLLIAHSKTDEQVPFEEALAIQAEFPASTLTTLEHADHLLRKREDADYVCSVVDAWADQFN